MNVLKTLVLCVSITGLVACGQKTDGGGEAKPAVDKAKPAAEMAKPAAAMEMAPLEIKSEEFTAMMDAPKGATMEDSYGTLEVKVGDGSSFFVAIETDAPDMASIKGEVEKNDVQKLKKFHMDTPEAVIYETEAFGKTSFWLDAAIKVGDKTVHCFSGRGAPSFTQPQVESFLAACKTLKPKG